MTYDVKFAMMHVNLLTSQFMPGTMPAQNEP